MCRKDTRTDSKSHLPPSAGLTRVSPHLLSLERIWYYIQGHHKCQPSNIIFPQNSRKPGKRGQGETCGYAPLRHRDSQPRWGRQSRRCLESNSLPPPQAALRRFPRLICRRQIKKFKSFSAGHPPEGPLLPRWGNSPSVPAENSLTQPPWAAFTSPQTGEGESKGGTASPSLH